MQTHSRGSRNVALQSRVLTHWADIVNRSDREIAHPVDVGYARGGMGAALTVLIGRASPVLEMQRTNSRQSERLLRLYAIARIRIRADSGDGMPRRADKRSIMV
jgi:hypothetical protein